MIFSVAFFISVFLLLSLARLVYNISGDVDYLMYISAIIALSPLAQIWGELLWSDSRLSPYTLNSRRNISASLGIFAVFLLTLFFWFLFSSIFFFLVLALGIWWHIDTRIAFSFALISLILTILALIFSLSAIAESMSILVYLLLVLWVSIEIVAPILEKYHRKDDRTIVPEKIHRYYREHIYEYLSMVWLGFQIFVIILLLGRPRFWDFDSSILFVFCNVSVVVLFLAWYVSQYQSRRVTLYTSLVELDISTWWIHIGIYWRIAIVSLLGSIFSNVFLLTGFSSLEILVILALSALMTTMLLSLIYYIASSPEIQKKIYIFLSE
jgi:hypothetical protein